MYIVRIQIHVLYVRVAMHIYIYSARPVKSDIYELIPNKREELIKDNSDSAMSICFPAKDLFIFNNYIIIYFMFN